MSRFRKSIKVLIWILSAICIAQLPVAAKGETTRAAFVSPDGRNVDVGYWRGFFYPNAFLPLSYLPMLDAITPYHRQIFGAVLPHCDGSQSACVSEVSYQLPGGEWKTATPTADTTQRDVYQGSLLANGEWELHKTSLYPEDLRANRPQGDAARVWVFAEAPHGGGNAYQVSAQLTGSYLQTGQYLPENFSVQVVPQKRVRISADSATKDCVEPQSTFIRNSLNDTYGNCVTNFDFPRDLNIRIKIKLSTFLSSINGWFDSRIKDLIIDIDEASKTLTLEGKPLVVPTAATRAIKYADVESQGLAAVSKEVQELQTRGNTGTAGVYQLNTPQSLEAFIKLDKNILDTALGENTIWQMSSLSQTPENSKCLNKGIINGIVSTNATVYDSTAPKWNDLDSSLNFRVAAAHQTSTNEIFQGYYSMIVNSVTAKCYWGENLSRATASISILGQDGDQKVASTSVTSKAGWTYFNASGFTFSAPTIKVKYLIPAPTPTPTPSPSASAAASVDESAKPQASIEPSPKSIANQQKANVESVVKKRKTTITCTKGKVVQKVTAINPKCPKGFKKK